MGNNDDDDEGGGGVTKGEDGRGQNMDNYDDGHVTGVDVDEDKNVLKHINESL